MRNPRARSGRRSALQVGRNDAYTPICQFMEHLQSCLEGVLRVIIGDAGPCRLARMDWVVQEIAQEDERVVTRDLDRAVAGSVAGG